MNDKELYALVGMSKLPHILSLVDTNPLSPTYGCFDRSFWHYKTSPFPSGMYQESVLVLALVHTYQFPGGQRYYKNPRLKDLALAGIHFARRSSHKDGSCDDYFPFERALGATAFSLYGCTEAYIILDLQDEEILDFFVKRARWLMRHQESGRLSNHQALVALCLYNTHLITGEKEFLDGAKERISLLKNWQHTEGWFPEYDGCDPGYLTATIDFLAKYLQKSGDEGVMGPLDEAVRFATNFMHPDGSYGGTYGSRNTYLFFPHGFELMGKRVPEALWAADRYLMSISRDTRVHLEDDRICAHLAYNHFQAYLDYCHEREGRPPEVFQQRGMRWWPGARLLIYREGERHVVVSTAKGGVVRVYRGEDMLYTDSGLIAKLRNGRVLVSHLMDDYKVVLSSGEVQVEGNFGICRFRLPSVLSSALFHLGMLIAGRLWSDGVRRVLQRLLIVGKRPDKMRFRRTFRLHGETVSITDEVWNPDHAKGGRKVEYLYAGVDHTSIYVAVSRCFQGSMLFPWVDYCEHLQGLNQTGYMKVERSLE